ncbi:hypothetical protein Si126_01958 [Streptococcus infantarius subsp. infantarius]|nr:hypothetical protein [Streptococcus infantarius subsp. infantarius]
MVIRFILFASCSLNVFPSFSLLTIRDTKRLIAIGKKIGVACKLLKNNPIVLNFGTPMLLDAASNDQVTATNIIKNDIINDFVRLLFNNSICNTFIILSLLR